MVLTEITCRPTEGELEYDGDLDLGVTRVAKAVAVHRPLWGSLCRVIRPGTPSGVVIWRECAGAALVTHNQRPESGAIANALVQPSQDLNLTLANTHLLLRFPQWGMQNRFIG